MLLEICVDDIEGLDAAIRGGADRVELCAGLALGGLTPSPGLIHVAAACPIPIYSMIRPRGGDFVYSEREVSTMMADIDQVRRCGLAGVVFGASLEDGGLDRDVLRRLVDQAEGLGLTLHRAFDLVPDQTEALEIAIELGFERILTSGGASSAIVGVDSLAKLIDIAASRMSIMPASGITGRSVDALLGLEVTEIHAWCEVNRGPVLGKATEFGFESETRPVVSEREVRELRARLPSGSQLSL